MEAPPGAAGTWVGGTRAGIPRALARRDSLLR